MYLSKLCHWPSTEEGGVCAPGEMDANCDLISQYNDCELASSQVNLVDYQKEETVTAVSATAKFKANKLTDIKDDDNTQRSARPQQTPHQSWSDE